MTSLMYFLSLIFILISVYIKYFGVLSQMISFHAID